MSGHSKWHNIRLRKGKQDAERGKLFTRLSREIIMAARAGGGNPDGNLRLKIAMQKARESSMPQDKVKNAIQRGTGELEGANYDELVYEGYGPAGVAVLVETATDNKNRTVAELRHLFSRSGGSLGASGSVAWRFEQRGQIIIPRNGKNEEEMLEAVLEAGAEDMESDAEVFTIYTAPSELNAAREALEASGLPVTSADVVMVPTTTVEVEGKDAEVMLKLMDQLEEHDDVQNVWANFDMDESLLAAHE